MSGTHPGLLDLPVELVEWIARSLMDPQDLLNLRKSCRQLDAITVHIVAEKCFRYLSFYFTDRKSMMALADIASHPVFSRYVLSVGLAFAQLQSPEKDQSLRLEAMPGSTADRVARRARYRVVYHRLAEKHASFRDSTHPRLLLQDALLSFKTFTQPVDIQTDSLTTFCRPKPVGFRSVARALGYDECFRDCPDGGELFGSESASYYAILEAIRRTSYPVKNLSLGSAFGCIELKAFHPHLMSTPSFHNLTDLSLQFRDEFGDWGQRDMNRFWPSLCCLSSLLFQAVGLRDLKLMCDPGTPIVSDDGLISLDRYLFNYIAVWARDKALMKLSSFYLCGFMVDFESLMRFLRIRRNTLEDITMFFIRDGIRSESEAQQRVIDQLSVQAKISVASCYDGWQWLQSSFDPSLDQATATDLFGPDTTAGRHCSATVSHYLAQDPLENWSIR